MTEKEIGPYPIISDLRRSPNNKRCFLRRVMQPCKTYISTHHLAFTSKAVDPVVRFYDHMSSMAGMFSFHCFPVLSYIWIHRLFVFQICFKELCWLPFLFWRVINFN